VFSITMLIYATLGMVAAIVIRGFTRRWREDEAEPGLPYAPPDEGRGA
jgi:hypothetical protein